MHQKEKGIAGLGHADSRSQHNLKARTLCLCLLPYLCSFQVGSSLAALPTLPSDRHGDFSKNSFTNLEDTNL